MAKSIQGMKWWQRWLYHRGLLDSEGKFAGIRISSKITRWFLPLTDRLAGKDVRAADNPLITDIQLDLIHPARYKIAIDRIEYWMKKMANKDEYPPILLTSDNVIIDGHARFFARLKLGLRTISVIKLNPKDSEFTMAGGVLRIKLEKKN